MSSAAVVIQALRVNLVTLTYLQNKISKPRCSKHQITNTASDGNLLYTDHQNHTSQFTTTYKFKWNFWWHLKLFIINPRIHQNSVVIIGNTEGTFQRLMLHSNTNSYCFSIFISFKDWHACYIFWFPVIPSPKEGCQMLFFVSLAPGAWFFV